MAPQAPTLKHISPLYKFYFLYFDPFMALVGASMISFNPQGFLQGSTPGNVMTVHPLAITPVVQLLLTNIASLYVLIAIVQGGVLRLTKETNVWLGVLGGMLISDLGHLYAVYEAAPDRLGRPGNWGLDEWFSNGTLIVGAGLRLLFLLGFGRD